MSAEKWMEKNMPEIRGLTALTAANVADAYAEESRREWLEAAMLAQEALESIKRSLYRMPASQYNLMVLAISGIQKLWESELASRSAKQVCANCNKPYDQHLFFDGNKCEATGTNGWFPKAIADAISRKNSPTAREKR